MLYMAMVNSNHNKQFYEQITRQVIENILHLVII